MSRKAPEKPENFVGWKSDDGKLEVVGIADETCKNGRKLFKVTCAECSKDKELFPEGYFVSVKSNLIKNIKPCGCGMHPRWKDWQYLALARRAGEKKGFVVHGFAETFKKQKTKLNLECLKDGHKWTATLSKIINSGTGCPKCAIHSNKEKRKTPEHTALQKCIDICKEMNYDVIGFVDKYKGAHKTRFEYICKIHGKQNVTYKDFIHGSTRCGGCAKDENIRRLREDGNGNGYYQERKDEQDYLYILNFNNQFVKVGRSFDVNERVRGLRSLSKIKKIYKLRIFTAIHQEIYDLEQELHNELRERNFQYHVCWSNECFDNDCHYVLNKLLDKCGLDEVGL